MAVMALKTDESEQLKWTSWLRGLLGSEEATT
jgi:hypothetical protein